MPGKRYPRTVKDLVDQDYAYKLCPEDRAYLDKFNDEFYGASFTEEPLHHDLAQRRELYRTKNRRNADVIGRFLPSGKEPNDEEAPDINPVAEALPYLDDPRYREALSEFRAALPTDGRQKTRLTPEFVAAKHKIKELTRLPGDTPAEEFQPTMARKRIDRLKHTREQLFNAGVIVANSTVPGVQAKAVGEALDFLEASVKKLDEKLRGLGVVPYPPLSSVSNAQGEAAGGLKTENKGSL